MSKTDLIIETKRLSNLSPALYNQRTITAGALDGLRHSVERFGLVEPVIWNRQTGHAVGGHQDGGWAFREMKARPAGPGESRGEKARSSLVSQLGGTRIIPQTEGHFQDRLIWRR